MLKTISHAIYTHRKVLAPIFAIYCALLAVGILIGACFSPSAYGGSGDTNFVDINDNWRILEDDKEISNSATLPYVISNKGCSTVDLYRVMPDAEFLSGVLITTIYQKELDVSLDGKLLYSYHPTATASRTFTPGSGRFFITLPEGFAGKELHLRYTRTVPADNSAITTITLNSALRDPYFFVRGSDLLFVLMLSLFITGLVLLALAITTGGRGLLAVPLFPLAIFALSSSLWISCNTKIVQLFTQNLILLHNLEYISFYIMPVALWMFAWLNWHYCPKVTLPLLTASASFFALSLTLKFFGIMDFFILLPIFHLLVLLCFVFFMLSVRLTYHTEDFSIKMFFWGFGAMSFCCVLEIFRYYLRYSSETIFSFFLVGIMLLIGCTIASFLYSVQRRMQSNIENTMYKQLAYTDKLTGIRNRLTFEEDVERLELEQDIYSSIIFANMDINSFKNVNDTFGHVTGDDVLKAVASELSTVCQTDNRRCYRLGGDEFCIIALENSESDLHAALEQMNDRLEHAFALFPVSVAFGVCEYNRFLHTSLMEVFTNADALMYKSKQSMNRRQSDRTH